MARGNQRDKAREANLKKQAAMVSRKGRGVAPETSVLGRVVANRVRR